MEPAVVQQEVHQNISKELGAYDMKNINELRALKKEIYIYGGLAYGEYKGIEGPAEGNIHSVYMGLRSTILAGPTTGSAPECKE